MIEKPPALNKINTKVLWKIVTNSEYDALFHRINNKYLYWDKVKYKAPAGVDPATLWYAVKIKRNSMAKRVILGKSTFSFSVTGKMQELLHLLDFNLGGTLGTQGIIPEKDKKFYLVNSIMEEAIASSQMEGASQHGKWQRIC